MKNNPVLKALASKAFVSVILAYMNIHKGNWDIKSLDIQKVNGIMVIFVIVIVITIIVIIIVVVIVISIIQ